MLAGAACRRTPAPEALYQEARAKLRAGDLRAALAFGERAGQAWRDQPGSKPYWQFRLFRAEVLLSQGKAKDALPLLQPALPAGPDFRELSARQRLLLGQACFLLGQTGEARRVLEEGLRQAPDGLDSPLAGEFENRLGPVLARLGDTAAAQQRLRRARAIAVLHQDAFLEASILNNAGFIRLSAGRFDEALPWFEQAARLAEQSGARQLVAASAGNLGRCYYFLGDSEKTLRLLNQAAEAAAQAGDAGRTAIWLNALGDAYEQRGDLARAIGAFRRALALQRELGDDVNLARSLVSLSRTFLRAGDLSQATQCIEEALILAVRLHQPPLEIWAVQRRAEILAAKKEFAAAEKAYRQVLASAGNEPLAQFAAHAGLAAVYVDTHRWGAAEREFRGGLQVLERSQTGMARDDWKFSFLASAGRFYGAFIDYLMERGQVERALEVAESARGRVLAGRLAGTAAPVADAAHFREVARRSGAVLVSFWLTRRRSFAWVVRPDKIESFPLPPEADLEGLIRDYDSAIESVRDPLETANPAGRQLAEVLLRPLTRRVPAGSRVVVVPDGGLNELNFETLPASGSKYWIEDVTVAIAPSLSLLETQPAARPEKPVSLLLIGNPVPPAPEYPALPDAAKEIESIAGCFQHKLVLTGASAPPGAYRAARPGQFTFIHFSAHATANRESPLDSAVILSPQGENWKLYAREVIGIPLQARLVTVSACRGAGARWYAGEGLVGFTWAFLQAGAQNVIAGLWDVNDRSTAELMRSLYSALAQGRGPAAALRTAKLELLRSKGAYRKPYYWAPFELFARSCDF